MNEFHCCLLFIVDKAGERGNALHQGEVIASQLTISLNQVLEEVRKKTTTANRTFLWAVLESMAEVDGVVCPQKQSPHLHF